MSSSALPEAGAILAIGRDIYALNTTERFTIAGSLLDYPKSMEKLGPAPHPAYGTGEKKAFNPGL
jgi:hypothetical protein